MSNWLSQEDFEFIYQRTPRICVDLIFKSNGKVLLTKRTGEPHLDKWHIPGGAVRFKESINDAIMRLATGELNINVTRYRFIGIMEFRNEVREGKDYHSISLGYLVQSMDKPSNGEFFYEFPDFTIPEHLNFLNTHFAK